MRPSGLAELEAAKTDGRWAAAYESQRNATVPPDLAAALAASPPAAQTFDTLSKTRQYAAILKLVTTRTATARAAQLHRTMTALEHAAPELKTKLGADRRCPCRTDPGRAVALTDLQDRSPRNFL